MPRPKKQTKNHGMPEILYVEKFQGDPRDSFCGSELIDHVLAEDQNELVVGVYKFSHMARIEKIVQMIDL